jgi:predicted amidohydrolase
MSIDLAIAQFRPTKGDTDATLADVRELLARADALEPRPQLVVFPESALTGYFLEGGVREEAMSAESLFERLRAHYAEVADAPLDIALGFYELRDRKIYNSALYAELGGDEPRIVHVHRKAFLPTYGVFQEERFVEAGAGIAAFDTRIGRIAMLICEEAFHSISGTVAALDGAELMLVLSASPARGAEPGPGMPGNIARWDLLGSGLAGEHGVFVVVSQLAGFEGGKGFAGGSAAYSPRGNRIARGPLWADGLIPVRIDLEDVVSARAEEPLLADLERMWMRLLIHSPGARISAPDPESDAGGAATAGDGEERDG